MVRRPRCRVVVVAFPRTALPLPVQEEFYGKEVIVADREMVEMVRHRGAVLCP